MPLNSNQQVTLNIGDSVIENTKEEKLLDVVINKESNCLTHISDMCVKQLLFLSITTPSSFSSSVFSITEAPISTILDKNYETDFSFY